LDCEGKRLFAGGVPVIGHPLRHLHTAIAPDGVMMVICVVACVNLGQNTSRLTVKMGINKGQDQSSSQIGDNKELIK